MFLREIFLSETANEDRAIVSLAGAVSKMIRQKYPPGTAPDESVDLGKVSDYLNTPLEALGDISIVINPQDELLDDPATKNQTGTVVDGVWDPSTTTVHVSDRVLKKADQSLLRILTHEFRHALDDIKSNFRAGKSKRYDTPKNKEYRNADSHQRYLASPAEINARFAEVMSLMVLSIQKLVKEISDPNQIKKQAYADLDRFMKAKKVSSLFPEKEKSKDYKRLMSRAVDFIDKELAYKASQRK